MLKRLTATTAIALAFAALSAPVADTAGANELVGFASLPADTFAPGPTSGQLLSSPINGRTPPFVDAQPVQGFSGVQFAPGKDDVFWFLSDNGFGGQANSPDYVLRIYQIDPNFATPAGGDGSVAVQDFIQLRDPNNVVGFPIVADQTSYPGTSTPVAPEITNNRLLTGGDFDVESFVIANNGDIWVGDEFGPFLLHFDATGVLQEAPIPTPDLESDGSGGLQLSDSDLVRSPQNPFLADPADANLPGSGGFEGMASTPDGSTYFPLLEKMVEGDPEGALRIYAFDPEQGDFTDFVGFYMLEEDGSAIGDFTFITEDEYLVIERDGGQGDAAEFKKVFKVDLSDVDEDGNVAKMEIVDLLNIDDPNDLNEDGETTFDFPFVTIEDVLVIDNRTILVANDNNYPFSMGREGDIDNNEIILIRLDNPLVSVSAPAALPLFGFALAALARIARRRATA